MLDFVLIRYGYLLFVWEYSGLMVNARDSGLTGPGYSPDCGPNVLCSWDVVFPLTMPLSTLGYKWVWANSSGNLTECWE